jgi:plastocyanin
MSIPFLIFSLLAAAILTLINLSLIIYAQVNTTFDNNSSDMSNVSSLSTDQRDISTSTNVPSPNSIPIAKSIFDSGTMTLPSSVKGIIILIPDEAHHPPADQKTISPKNPNYLPNKLEIPEGTEVAFVHNDPGHLHVGIIKDKDGNTVWTTNPVKFPDGSDSRTLSVSGSPYGISDKQYSPPMEGKIVVTAEKSTGALTVGGFFCPTKQLPDCKSQFSKAGFKILSEHNFNTKSVQKDISGPNTLLIYSTKLPVKDAITSLGPIIKSLPYK